MAALLFTQFPLPVTADTIATHDWDPTPGPGVWSSEYGWAGVDTPAAGGNPDGWLRVTFANTSDAPGPSWTDIINTPAANFYAGTWSQGSWLQFDFWASNQIPNSLQVRWKSTTNSYIWGNPVEVPASTGSWVTIQSSSFANWDNWDIDGFASEEQFLADLNSIEWIGIRIQRTTEFEQIYGIDNVMLMIPEPAEWIMLAAALSVCAMALRQKLPIQDDTAQPVSDAYS